MRPTRSATLAALLVAGLALSGCYDRYGRPGHDSDRHGHRHGHDHGGDHDHDHGGR